MKVQAVLHRTFLKNHIAFELTDDNAIKQRIAAVCSLKCNDACNIGNDYGECLALAENIIRKEKIHRFNEVSKS